ncbi:MAG: glycogen synthase [Bacilli bacterium]|nr:glycogen synthase [Bacilli bacterium]
MDAKKIVIVASECQPFFASGGLADVIGSLPTRVAKLMNANGENNQVSVILPLYSKFTNPKYRNKLVYIGQTTVNLSWRKQYCGIFKYVEKGITYYFIDNEYYFKKSNYYGYFDDGERFAFFSKAAIETMIYLDIIPDIIHCHDWQAGLVPVYLRTLYYNDERFKDVRRIFTVHNIEYQGIYSYDEDIIQDVFGIPAQDGYILEYRGHLNIMKGAMESSNFVSTVSPTYAEEIQYAYFAKGLEFEVERIKQEGKLRGILNGIDKTFYNPAKDDALFVKYDKKTPELKAENKVHLQEMLGLTVNKDIPLIGMVTRLVSHKGMDLVKAILSEVLKEKVQVVILGTGDSSYEWFLRDMERAYQGKLSVIIAFNQDLSRKIYASSDLFLMPSLSEPCGLAQMIACRYGALPIVRKTGGLADSIKDFSLAKGNGYVFDNINADELLAKVKQALADYEDKALWAKHVKAAMACDFGWTASAKKYVEMYEELLNK